MRGFSLLSSILVLVSSAAAKSTMVGIETETESRGVSVLMDDCQTIDEYEVYTVAITKKCRLFTGPMCTGRTTLLQPGDHSVEIPVPVGSVLCEEPDLF